VLELLACDQDDTCQGLIGCLASKVRAPRHDPIGKKAAPALPACTDEGRFHRAALRTRHLQMQHREQPSGVSTVFFLPDPTENRTGAPPH